MTASTHSCKTHAKSLGKRVWRMATCSGRKREAEMLCGRDGTWLWNLSFQLPQIQEESVILFKLPLDLLTAKQWHFAARGSSLQCGWTLFFQENSVLSGLWLLSAQMGKAGYGVVRQLKHSYFFLLKKPKQTGRSVSWLLDRDGRMKQFSWPKQPYEHFWPWIFITRSKVLHAATLFFLTRPLFGHHPCRCWSFVSRQKSPFSCFPIPAYWPHNCSGSYSLSSGLLTHIQLQWKSQCPHTFPLFLQLLPSGRRRKVVHDIPSS